VNQLPDIDRLLQSENEEQRLLGLKLLAEDGVEKHLGRLSQLMGDVSWRVRKEAAGCFLAMPNAAALSGEIIELLHSQDNAGLRNTAVEILVKFGRLAVPQLLEEIACPDHDVRKFVIDILGDIGDERAIPPLVCALDDPDTNVRAAAAENLGKLKAVDAVTDLLAAMADADLMFRFTILEALAMIGTQVPTTELLRYRDVKLLRKALFDSLGLIGDENTAPVLIEGLLDDMRDVREAAAIGLVRLQQRDGDQVAETLIARAHEEILESLSELTTAKNQVVRRSALQLLGLLADGRAVAALLPLLEDQNLAQQAAAALVAIGRREPEALINLWPTADANTRVYLAYLYGEAECQRCVTQLREGLRAEQPNLRHAAAQSLGKLGDPLALSALVEALNDEHDDVSEAIVGSLSRLGAAAPEACLQAVLPLLEEDDPFIRSSAVTVLGRLRGPEVERALSFALKDEAAEVRQAAVKAMSESGDSDQLPALQLAMTDENVEVRRMATEVLGRLGSAEALPALELALQDEDIWVRTAGVRALGQLTVPEAQVMVRRALQDPVGMVVIAALEVIVEIEPAHAREALLNALRHFDEEVVNAALKGLAAHGDSSWVQVYGEALLNHGNWEVRLTTARALVASSGQSAQPLLEARLLVEGEDLVRLEIEELLQDLKLPG